MRKTIKYHIWPQDLIWSEVISSITKSAEKRGFRKLEHTSYDLTLNEYENIDGHGIDEVIKLLERPISFKCLSCEWDYISEDSLRNLRIQINYSSREIKLEVRSVDVDLMETINSEIICLVSKSESQEWLASEASYALGKNKHVLLLVEKDTIFKPSLLGGDLEQVRFYSGRIEMVFVPILSEFRRIHVKGLFGPSQY